MEGLKALIAAIKELPKLSSLRCANRVPYLILPILDKCDIGLWHTRHWYEWVPGADIHSLPLCSLSDNKIGEKGAAELAKVLPECKSLVWLR